MTRKMKSKRVRKRCTEDECEELKDRIFLASALMWDYDGWYNPETRQGNIEGLADTLRDAYMILQGQMWESNSYDKLPTESNQRLRKRKSK
jgi:hypothetical protein